MLHSALNVALRLVTKNALRWAKANNIAVAAAGMLLLTSCASTNQVLEPNIFYKRDIGIEVNNRTYEGVVVVPKASRYSLLLRPKGKLDLVLVRSCHREFSGEKLSPGFLGMGGGAFKYEYVPTPGLEDVRVCPLRIEVYEATRGRHSWSLIDFEHESYRLQYLLQCNGSVSRPNGVGVCQTKAGLLQRLTPDEPIRFAPPEPVGCALPMKKNGAYEFAATLGECLYQFDTREGKLGRLTVIAYDGVLVRETQ